MNTWLDANAEGLGLMLACGLIGIVFLLVAAVVENFNRREWKQYQRHEQARKAWKVIQGGRQ